MYKLHLILKYLRKRRIAWVSLIAVTLCTAMVLVVISVMGGWLRMFEENFHGLSGDLIVSAKTLGGFSYYDRMIPEIEKLPEVSAAVPVIKTYGLINIGRQKTDGVQVIGYPLDKIGKVNRFPESLYFQYQQYLEAAKEPGTPPDKKQELLKDGQKSLASASYNYRPLSSEEYAREVPHSENWPGIIVGAGLLDIRKGHEGQIEGRELWKYGLPVKLILFNTERSISDPDAVSQRAYWIADDSRTQVWQYDSTTVYVPFDVIQRDLGMNTQEVVSDLTGKKITRPARTSEIHVAVKPGFDLMQTKAKVQDVVDRVMDQAREQEQQLGAPSWSSRVPIVETWRESQAMWIGAVENEKVLVVGLFGIISLVAVMLILAIFYMIVMEKTRDIGTMRAVGASMTGVAGVFIGYGAAIGIVGSGLGLLAGYLIVHNINMLHQKLGDLMGIQIWKPEVYVFDIIPNQINPHEATVIVIIAILASIAGSLIPALRAGSMNPVEALRWE